MKRTVLITLILLAVTTVLHGISVAGRASFSGARVSGARSIGVHTSYSGPRITRGSAMPSYMGSGMNLGAYSSMSHVWFLTMFLSTHPHQASATVMTNDIGMTIGQTKFLKETLLDPLPATAKIAVTNDYRNQDEGMPTGVVVLLITLLAILVGVMVFSLMDV